MSDASSGVIHLPPIEAEHDDDRSGAGADHPMRVVTVESARDASTWTAERRSEVAALFDGLSAEWHTRDGPGRDGPLRDAFVRGEVSGGRCLELGSGTGLTTATLVEHFDTVVAEDLAMDMLRIAPGDVAPRVQVDATRLPHPARSIDALVLMNMLLFPDEVNRVLASDGAVVWVNSRGPGTPIHLPAEAVVDALGDGWFAVASTVGAATWCVARR